METPHLDVTSVECLLLARARAAIVVEETAGRTVGPPKERRSPPSGRVTITDTKSVRYPAQIRDHLPIPFRRHVIHPCLPFVRHQDTALQCSHRCRSSRHFPTSTSPSYRRLRHPVERGHPRPHRAGPPHPRFGTQDRLPDHPYAVSAHGLAGCSLELGMHPVGGQEHHDPRGRCRDHVRSLEGKSEVLVGRSGSLGQGGDRVEGCLPV
ncbi:hypothetical protein FFLO_03704 [Filobasidium floriforme]|uniref:Uncharacterized protein n=1 Tax=Filobasidium floriforme TaxID=5210 RepID=A0A8K0NQJ9_9TREE|nr:uncharacterized protein HD553DRAFT_166436 [Filobasidium floriforme]KAG7532236.1 hypothetical protein FFLO_03704 [Filobasidium floriforme]KAH8077843.1 hypothetical protein HD553DRAFT_166436 [Filobasidium floriforme]